MDQTLEELLAEIRACTVCETVDPPLPHAANPVCVANSQSKIRIIGQAPGNLVNLSGRPFTDPSGVRLRDWLGITEEQFYNPDLFAITPMGFCFPGNDAKGGDLPPRKECAALYQERLTDRLAKVELTLLIGAYAQKQYLGQKMKRTLTETVRNWREYGPDIIPLPHPSWRNNGWIKKHDWFPEVLAILKTRVKTILSSQ